MFKFKGISSNDMQVVIEEEEHFIARAARRYETTEIEGRDGAIFNELGYSYVERPIYVQCLNPNKIDDILEWLDGEGEFEYKGRKTTARFYSQLEPQRETVIRIIDTTFIRDPFWIKLEDESVEVKGDKEKNAEGENINLKGTIPVKFKEFKVSGNSKQETRSGKNLLPYPYDNIANTIIQDLGDGRLTLNGTIVENVSKNIKTFDLKAGNYKFLFNNENLPNNSYFYIRNQDTFATLKTNIKTNTTFTLEEDVQILIYLVLVAGTYSNYEMDLMILEATEEDETWEPYGAMPSPEFPSEIQNVEGNVDISVCNKNLFNSKNLKNTRIITVNEDGSITLANNPNIVGYTDTGKKLKELCPGLKVGDIAYLKTITTFTNTIYLQGATGQYWYSGNSKEITEDMLEDIVTLYGGYQKTDTLQIQITKNSLEDYVPHQVQTVNFPLAQGQKLMLGDYLASDGIHHVRKQVELDGTENITVYNRNYTTGYAYRIPISGGVKPNSNLLCTKYKSIPFVEFYNTDTNIVEKCATHDTGSTYVYFGSSKSTLEEFKQEILGTTVEYELTEEEIETYTPEQQEAYNQICNLKAYEGETNIYSTNEISPIFKVTYIEETTEKIENEGNIYSRPILRLKKTSYNNVDIEIAGTRFQYNFNDESYIEIDCEEKTALYEGFNRNRQLTIGYEFPKLAPGENDIKMYEGDCIIEVKRKDRWL